MLDWIMPWKRVVFVTLFAAASGGCWDDSTHEPNAGGAEPRVDSGPRDSGSRDAMVTDAGKMPLTDAGTNLAVVALTPTLHVAVPEQLACDAVAQFWRGHGAVRGVDL
jgi:hypothetical protein